MATSLAVHTRTQPDTGGPLDVGLHARRGRGRRGPDVVHRLLQPSRTAGRAAPTRCSCDSSGGGVPRLRGRASCCNYSLLICYYPTAALAWILGAFNAHPVPRARAQAA